MKAFFLFLTVASGFFLSCVSPGITGSGGGSETHNGITALVMNTDGEPAAGSIVRMRRTDYLSQPAALAKQVIDRTDIITDQNGRFMITGIDSGAYYLEVQDTSTTSNGGAVLFTFSIDETSDTINKGTVSLSPLAAVVGVIDTGLFAGQQPYVQIKGLERLARVDSDG